MPKLQSTTPTIRDVARIAKVGLMTVSRVINNHPSVRPTTRKKVEAAIVQLGYRQNEAARLLKGQRAMLIGLIVPDLSDTFFASCAHTVQQIARSHGYMTLVVSSERDAELEFQEAELMAGRKVSGLLIVTSTEDGDARIRDLQKTGLAVVAFDRPLSGVETDCVLVENRIGTEEAIQHLIDHGHKRIACVGYDEQTYTVHERIEGYTHKMNSSGLKPQLVTGLQNIDDLRKWFREIRGTKNAPTAIFTLNHRTSRQVLQVLAENNVRIPDEIAIIGFDDFELADVVQPPMTTVAQSPVEITRRAMALLMEGIKKTHDGINTAPAKIMLPVKLMVRRSCGKHKESSHA